MGGVGLAVVDTLDTVTQCVLPEVVTVEDTGYLE